MKLFKRIRIAVLLAVCAVAWAGSAWADANSVVQIIQDYGLVAEILGNTITVTGSKTNATSALYLEDISDLTIDWQATLECTDSDALASSNNAARPNEGERRDLVIMSGNGNFNITGGSIKLSGGVPVEPNDYPKWPRMVRIGNDVQATISGGTLEMTLDEGVAIADQGNNNIAQITINGGTITAPYGYAAFATTVTVNDSSKLTGIVQNNAKDKLDVYGDVTCKVPFDDSEAVEEGSRPQLTVKASAHFTLEADFTFTANITTMTIESDGKLTIARGATLDNGGTVTNYGTIDIYGAVTNRDNIINHRTGTINNYSGNTLDNRGTLTITPA